MTRSDRMVLVTGASGFVGSAMVRRLILAGVSTRAAVRREIVGVPTGAETVRGSDLNATFDWTPAVAGCDAIVHTAARVHLMQDSAISPLSEFRRVNVDGTLRLAQQAADAGVRRFVFLSSIKVNGEQTEPGCAFSADDAPAPEDAYALSKYEAETALRDLGAKTGMEVVCIRPVLVYGPGVKANFLTMIRWVAQGIPLPFGAIRNQRSLVGLDNLTDLVAVCVRHPAAANRTFLVSDGEDLSTTELLRRIAAALGRPARLLPIPQMVLEAGGTVLGKRRVVRRLLGSLCVDIAKTRELLNWTPPVSIDQQLLSTASWFLNCERSIV